MSSPTPTTQSRTSSSSALAKKFHQCTLKPPPLPRLPTAAAPSPPHHHHHTEPSPSPLPARCRSHNLTFQSYPLASPLLPPHHSLRPHKIGPKPVKEVEEGECCAPSPVAAKGPCTLTGPMSRRWGRRFPDRPCPQLGLLAAPHGATRPLRQQRRAARPRRQLRALPGPAHVMARGAACAGSIARSASRPWPRASPSLGCRAVCRVCWELRDDRSEGAGVGSGTPLRLDLSCSTGTHTC
jgi:hypothetical protein